jgi:hypothetical protein
MSKNFFSLGYNLANPNTLLPQLITINNHEYSTELDSDEPINITAWWNIGDVTTIQALFNIDLENIRSECALSLKDEIYLTIYAYTSGTKLLHQGEIVPIKNGQVSANMTIPAFEMANVVDFHAAIICRFQSDTSRKIGAPVITNSKLLDKHWRFALSGSHTQANVLHDDFSKEPRTSNSIWKIQIDDPRELDTWLEAQHSSVLRILVNQDLQEFVKQESVQVLLMTDLVMSALQSAIENDERLSYLQSGSTPEGTWAQFIKTYYDQVFINHSFGVKDYWHSDQSEIRTRVQHLMHNNLEIR